MMKIIYVVIGDTGPGIMRKVQSQVQNLNGIEGCTAELYIYSTTGDTRTDPIYENARFFYLPTPYQHPYLRALAFRRQVFAHLLRATKARQVDVLYIRGTPSDPFVAQFLKNCRAKVVFELNSILSKERAMQRRPWVAWFEEYYTRRALQRAGGFVGVTSSVLDYYSRLIKDSVPCFRLGNGFEVESVVLRRPPVFDGTDVRLIAVANFARWHGMDRVVNGLAAYKGQLKISLRIIGTGTILGEIKKQTQELGLQKRVSFLGEMYGNDLDEMFNQSHLALGPLAIHRKQLTTASSLKIREYLSRGIPFLLSGIDDDLDPSLALDFYLDAPSDDSPIDFSLLEPVAPTIFNDASLPSRMRHYAHERVGMKERMLVLYSFFNSL